MPDFLPAIGSALIWAMSAQILNAGLTKIPDQNKIWALYTGLLTSLTIGTICLALANIGNTQNVPFNLSIILAGALTFPIGTGLYYFAGNAFGGRMEFASQFSNVKPVFSIGLAVVLLSEPVSRNAYLSIPLIIAGVALFTARARNARFSWLALMLGLMLALAWASGEVFIKLASDQGSSLALTFAAILSGTVIAYVLLGPMVFKNRIVLQNSGSWLWAFALHGFFSFFLAYTLMFESIGRIGLAKTVMINAFWPTLALIIAQIIAKWLGEPVKIDLFVYGSIIMLLAGCLLEIAAI